jgi:hypothetical protein
VAKEKGDHDAAALGPQWSVEVELVVSGGERRLPGMVMVS